MSKFKVRCIGFNTGERYFTLGNVYEWENDTLKNDRGHTYRDIVNGENHHNWRLSRWYTFERVDDEHKILITTNGTTTTARLYDGKKVVKSATAACAASDTFDFAVGANLAYDRLMDRLPVTPSKPSEKSVQEPIKLYCTKDDSGYLTKGKVYTFDGHQLNYDNGHECWYFNNYEEWQKGDRNLASCLVPLVHRPAKVGEYVLSTEDCYGEIRNNTVFICKKAQPNGNIRVDGLNEKFEMGNNIDLPHYLVLDGYNG